MADEGFEVTLRLWEVAGGAVLAIIGLIVMAGGAYGTGVATLAIVVLALTFRAKIVSDTNLAGGFALRRSTLEWVQTAAIGTILLAVLGTMVVAFFAGWNHDARGQTAIYALAGLEVLLLREFERRGDSAMHWLIGGRAERVVGELLDPLRTRGWLVAHDVLRESHGNIDHIVCGPTGSFAIETKSRGYVRRDDLGQARGNAAWLKERLNQGWVTAVLCLPRDDAPFERDQVWVVGQAQLQSWLERRQGRPVDVAAARAALGLDDESL